MDVDSSSLILGGEYLGELRVGEVEIARVSLESVTADQVSVRARRDGSKIRYEVDDEYEGMTLKQRWGPRSSSSRSRSRSS